VTALLVTFAVLCTVTSLVAWLIHLEVRRTERADAKFRALHPSQSRASVVDQPPGEHVRLIDPAPYDWQRWEDDSGTH
jgi:hypothetical protein